ncbi:MAG: hypothetical protein KIT09_20370 [Bryobacteraceae bacterium]|nr:hypothetical protein [Bryobacteraceae bacterium]
MRTAANLDPGLRLTVETILNHSTRFRGRAVRVAFLPDLRTRRGNLLSGATTGQEVHAGSDLRRRLIILDEALTASVAELRRILLHEIFHFAWRRLSTTHRLTYEHLISAEIDRGARGELGWSSEMRKVRLGAPDRLERTRRWRNYLCESFCDTGSWVLSEIERHEEFTLAPRFRRARKKWFEDLLSRRPRIPV